MSPQEGVVASLRQGVRALGPAFDAQVLQATQDLYRPHVDMAAVQERRDEKYGPAERHRLDVYLPQSAPKAVVVFVHGGGFIGGDKNVDGTFYVNIGRFLARAGYAAVLPCYRLAPGDPWPAAAHDVRDAIRWTRDAIPGVRSGEVPLVVIGQSAGAAHVATWLFDEETRSEALGPVRGVALLSGFYLAEAPLAENGAAYFGRDPSLYARRSPLTHVAPTDVPLWLGVAELDPGRLAAPTFRLAAALALANGRAPRVSWFRGHNHVSTVMSIGTPQTDVSDAILHFLAGCVTPGEPA